jgi:hypothetical protein
MKTKMSHSHNASKTVKKSPYTSLALAPITGQHLANFKRMVIWLAPKDKTGAQADHGLRWLADQFSFNDTDGKRRVMRSYGWFAFARNGQFDQISPLMIDYMLLQSIYNRERGIFKKDSDTDRAVRLITQAMTLLRPAIKRK